MTLQLITFLKYAFLHYLLVFFVFICYRIYRSMLLLLVRNCYDIISNIYMHNVIT